jgi:hypothetical protein
MNPPPKINSVRRFRKRSLAYAAAGMFLLVGGGCVVGVVGIFRLEAESRALRESVSLSMPGQFDKKFSVRLGGLTTALVRAGSHWVKLPPEARAGLDSLHGVEVGVYKSHDDNPCLNPAGALAAADKSMRGRGWTRIVGVAKAGDLVAIYMPAKTRSSGGVKCCVMVLHERDLVIGSLRGNLDPLLELAAQKLESGGQRLPLELAHL